MTRGRAALAFRSRPVLTIRTGDHRASRFSRMETPCMHRFFDRAGSTNGSRIAPSAVLPSA